MRIFKGYNLLHYLKSNDFLLENSFTRKRIVFLFKPMGYKNQLIWLEKVLVRERVFIDDNKRSRWKILEIVSIQGESEFDNFIQSVLTS